MKLASMLLFVACLVCCLAVGVQARDKCEIEVRECHTIHWYPNIPIPSKSKYPRRVLVIPEECEFEFLGIVNTEGKGVIVSRDSVIDLWKQFGFFNELSGCDDEER